MLDRLSLPDTLRHRWSRWQPRRRHPPLPPGWRTGPPDFVGVGSQRSGSGWWYSVALEAHPRVVAEDEIKSVAPLRAMPDSSYGRFLPTLARVNVGGKELHYFDRFWNGDVPTDFVERYHSLFPRPEGSLTGEWTPRYMYDHWSMRLLHQAAPDARILVILRDPIERFRSGMAMQRRRGFGLGRTLDEVASAVSRSAYAEQLRRVFDFFPRDRVLVLQYERCVADPLAEMERTCRFLGVEPLSELPAELLGPQRPPSRKPDLAEGMREDLVARLGPDVEQVVDLCPELDLTLWPNFRHLGAQAPPTDSPNAS
jgi:Sulfotransferase family